MIEDPLDARPIIIALAGSNGAGKTTLYRSFLTQTGLRSLNADEIAQRLDLDPYPAAALAKVLRSELFHRRESFIFETVFSDPVGDKVEFLKKAAASGYSVVLIFIGISSAATSEQRVAMRVTQGGHDVPTAKIAQRFARTLANLRRAIRELPLVLIFDNDELSTPYRKVAEYAEGKPVLLARPQPAWLKPPRTRGRRRRS